MQRLEQELREAISGLAEMLPPKAKGYSYVMTQKHINALYDRFDRVLTILARQPEAMDGHAADCLHTSPLPTGEGYWHCTCGYDSQPEAAGAVDDDIDDDRSCAPGSPEWQRGFNDGFKYGQLQGRDDALREQATPAVVDSERKDAEIRELLNKTDAQFVALGVRATPAGATVEGRQYWQETFEAALKDYVEGYEFHGEDKEGRETYYTPNERERLLIEDAIRGWEPPERSALAQAAPGDEYVLVRKEAIDWLNGESDFECPPDRYFRGEPPRYWWRSVFREKAGLAPPPGDDAAGGAA